MLRKTLLTFFIVGLGTVMANDTQTIVNQTLDGLQKASSDIPYSSTITQLHIGWKNGEPKTGVAYREIESFKTITGVVIVDKTEKGFILREALFPDLDKIKDPKERKQVLAILKHFKNVPFDPHAEKSAVDTVSGASRHGHRTIGYFNYMARHLALQMENPPKWAKPNK